MKAASGKIRSENKWPLPVLVRPRGVREILWTFAIVLIPIICLGMAGGAYLLLNLIFVTYLLRPSKRSLVKAMCYVFVIGLLLCALQGGVSEYFQQLVDAIRWSRGSDNGLWGYILRISVVTPFAFATLITLLMYDCRWVDRRKVDDRLWKRQLVRRRQILRSWHKEHNLEEVNQ